MKFKVCLLLLVLIFGFEYVNAQIVENNARSGKMVIQPKHSSIVKTNVYDNMTSSDYRTVISELEYKLKRNPDNISLYVPLVEAYTKAKNYRAAYDKLVQLLEIKENSSLPSNVLMQIDNMRNKTITSTRYAKDKSCNYINLAVMSLILDNNLQAQKYIKSAVESADDRDTLLEAIRLVFDRADDKSEAVNVCNLYSSLIKNNNEIIKMKIDYLLQTGNLSPALKEYNNLKVNLDDDVEDYVKYEFYQRFKEKNTDDKIIIKNLYGKNITQEEAYNNLYYLVKEYGSPEEAAIYVSKLAKEFPNSYMSSIVKAENYLNQGNREEAKKILDSIRDKITNEEEINRYNICLARMNEEPQKAAMDLFLQGHYDKALAILSDESNVTQSPTILALQGRCYMEMGNMQKALEILNKAIAMDPDDVGVLFQFANYYYQNGDYEAAQQYFDKTKIAFSKVANAQDPMLEAFENKLNAVKADSYINRVSDLYDAQNYKEAMNVVNKGLKIDNNSGLLHFYKGLIYIAQNNYAASTAELYKSIELDKDNVLSYYYLALAFDNLGEKSNALSYYRKFLDVIPEDYYGESDSINYAQARIKKLSQ